MKDFNKGLKAGIPIGLGYLSVSFTFGIMAVSMGFMVWQALMISMLTLTSAGQFAGITVMMNPGHYIEMLLSQITINIRYSFMSVSLSQKVSSRFNVISRAILGFFITDEIFAVAVTKKEVSRKFMAGLSILPYIGWSLGTLIGALLGNIMPERIMSALSLAIYGMFVAIVVPDMKKEKSIMLAVGLAMMLSSLFYFVPVLKNVSSGIAISVCAVVSSVVCAIAYPISDEKMNRDESSVDNFESGEIMKEGDK